MERVLVVKNRNMEINIKDGGQVERLNGKLIGVRINSSGSGSKNLELWLYSQQPNENRLPDESLSYLTIEEAMELIKGLKSAIRDAVNEYGEE
jgi:hypothetical protein